MIPASVPAVLDELQVLSLELERMPKAFTPTGWARPDGFPARSVATTSTHDMPSLRGWWHSLSASEQERYYARSSFSRRKFPTKKSSTAASSRHISPPHLRLSSSPLPTG